MIFSSLAVTGNTQEGATVKGKIVQSKYKDFGISFDELGAKIFERVKFPPPPLPDNWSELSVPDRQAWMKSFRESEKGQAYLANNEKIREAAQNFDIKIEKDGKFVVYDVPPGSYGLRGRVDKVVKDRLFAFEVFGQVEVLEDVDELALAPMMIMVTPLLKSGEVAPSFKVNTHDDSAELVNTHFRGKYLFLNFWSTESPPSVEFQSEVQKMFSSLERKHEIDLLSISVDTKRDVAISYIRKSKLRGRHGFTDGWDHRTLEAFGIRAIPSHWLIGPDGKILLTHGEFRQAFVSGKPDLATIVDDRIQGKDIPTPAGSGEMPNGSGL